MSSYAPDCDLPPLLQSKEKELISLSRLRIQRLEEQIRVKDQVMDELKDKLGKMQAGFDYNLRLIGERDEEMGGLEGKIGALKASYKAKECEVDALTASLHASESRIKTLEGQLQALNQHLSPKVSTQKQSKEMAVAALETAVKAKEEIIQSLGKEVKELKEEVRVRGETARKTEADLRTENEYVLYRQLKEQLKELKDNIPTLQFQHFTTTLQNEITQLSQQHSMSVEKLQTAHVMEVKQLVEIVEKEKDRRRKAEAGLKEAGRLGGLLDTLKREVEEKDAEISHLTTSLQTAQASHQSQENDLSRLVTELSSCHQQILALERRSTQHSEQCPFTVDSKPRASRETEEAERKRTKEDFDKLLRAESPVVPMQTLLSTTRSTLESLKKQVSSEQQHNHSLVLSSLKDKEALAQRDLEISGLRGKLEEVSKAKEVVESTEKNLVKELGGKREELANKEKDVIALKGVVQRLKMDLMKAEQAQDQAKDLIRKLKSELKRLKDRSTLPTRTVHTEPYEEQGQEEWGWKDGGWRGYEDRRNPTMACLSPRYSKPTRFSEKDVDLHYLRKLINSELDRRFDSPQCRFPHADSDISS